VVVPDDVDQRVGQGVHGSEGVEVRRQIGWRRQTVRAIVELLLVDVRQIPNPVQIARNCEMLMASSDTPSGVHVDQLQNLFPHTNPSLKGLDVNDMERIEVVFITFFDRRGRDAMERMH